MKFRGNYDYAYIDVCLLVFLIADEMAYELFHDDDDVRNFADLWPGIENIHQMPDLDSSYTRNLFLCICFLNKKEKTSKAHLLALGSSLESVMLSVAAYVVVCMQYAMSF